MMKFQHLCNALNNLNNPSILKIHGICFADSTQQSCVLFDYCPYNYKMFFDRDIGWEKVSCLYHLSLVMKEVHEHGIIHRNLKPENIILDKNMELKVNGFGISCFESVASQINLNKSVNTLIFMAPELLENNPIYDEKVDVYSFGYIAYYILSNGELPNIADAIKGRKFETPFKINKIADQLIRKCVSHNPKKRPSFSEIVEFFKIHEFKLTNDVGKSPLKKD